MYIYMKKSENKDYLWESLLVSWKLKVESLKLIMILKLVQNDKETEMKKKQGNN